MNLRRIFAPTLVALALLGAGCSGSRPTLAPATTARVATTVAPTTTVSPIATSLVAQAKADVTEVPVFATTDVDGEPKATLSNPNPNGAPLVFLVKQHQGDLYEVYLPIKPNSSTGWIEADLVDVSQNPYRLVVSSTEFRLTLLKDGEEVEHFTIGIGQDQYPTPGGIFYIKELLQPPNPDGAYGPYAYGLSGYTEVAELANFAGGNGTIGIHGTNDPSSIGKSTSHGCIRLSNEDVTKLAAILPLGTPVEIVS